MKQQGQPWRNRIVGSGEKPASEYIAHHLNWRVHPRAQAVEWDDNAVETFKLNFPGVPVYHGDIAKLSVEECLRLTGLEPGQLDVLDGSPPC